MGKPSPSEKGAAGAPAVRVRVHVPGQSAQELRFSRDFVVGSGLASHFRVVHAAVADWHLQVFFDGQSWWLRDLAGSTFEHGAPVVVRPFAGPLELELGKGGPRIELSLTLGEAAEPVAKAKEAAPAPQPSQKSGQRQRPLVRTDTQMIEQFFEERAGDGAAGGDAMAALARVRRRSRWYRRSIAAAALMALLAAAFIVLQKRKLAEQDKKLAALQSKSEELFYSAKALEVQISQLEALAIKTSDPQLVAQLQDSRAQLSSMDARYDSFVRELGTYTRLPKDEQVILRVARRFGECDVNVPSDFVTEVHRYVELLKKRDFFSAGVSKAKQKYGPFIGEAFAKNHLPKDFLFLALQESGLNERAVGPNTRYGYAKGMWQFISLTAHDYGLRTGPLFEQDVYDPKDERFDWQKETQAAARYIRDLEANVTQASGLLAMACYNWGENRVRPRVEALPKDARDRNFWAFLNMKGVPAETYDYVLSIFSMAVICEDPKTFGFEGECPFLPAAAAGDAAGG